MFMSPGKDLQGLGTTVPLGCSLRLCPVAGPHNHRQGESSRLQASCRLLDLGTHSSWVVITLISETEPCHSGYGELLRVTQHPAAQGCWRQRHSLTGLSGGLRTGLS